MDFYLSSVFVFPDFVFGDVPCGAHAKRPEGTICLDVRTQMLILFINLIFKVKYGAAGIKL